MSLQPVELPTEAAPTPGGAVGRRRISIVRRPGRRTLVIGASGVALLVAVALFAPLIAPSSATSQDLQVALQPPSLAHPFGTDQFGRDVASRVIYATRTDLAIAFIIVGIAVCAGTAIGTVSGFFGGVVDGALMRVVDVALAFPFIVLVIAIVAARGPSTQSLVFAGSLVWWVPYARLSRADALTIRELPYMLAARGSGFSAPRRMFRHLMPNLILQPLVYASSDVIYAILLASSVSFLGLGVQPPTPEWGQMVADAQNFATTAWWMALFPGIAIVITGIAFSLLGDGLAYVVSRTGAK